MLVEPWNRILKGSSARKNLRIRRSGRAGDDAQLVVSLTRADRLDCREDVFAFGFDLPFGPKIAGEIAAIDALCGGVFEGTFDARVAPFTEAGGSYVTGGDAFDHYERRECRQVLAINQTACVRATCRANSSRLFQSTAQPRQVRLIPARQGATTAELDWQYKRHQLWSIHCDPERTSSGDAARSMDS